MASASTSSTAPVFSTKRLAAAPGVVKLAVWAFSVAVVCGVIQAAAAIVGLDFWVFDKSNSVVLITVALTMLLALIALDSRPMAEYGVLAEKGWRNRAGQGVLLGVGVYAGCVLLGWSVGAVWVSTESVTGSRIAKAALAVLLAIPIALTQQIIFSGFLVGMLRRDHSRALSAVLPAVVFAVVASSNRWGDPAGAMLLAGLFVTAVLLNLLRLRTGSIALPTGLLAGCIMVRKVMSKTRGAGFDAQSAEAWWLAPCGDERMGLALGGLVCCGIVWASWRLYKHGEGHPVPSPEADAAFKRVLPFSNLMAFAPIERWGVLLWQARFRVGWQYVPRLVVTLFASAANSLISLPERLLAPLLLRHDPPDPVFLLGMPRSGTTHLHNLLSLDPRFRSPRNYEVFNPFGFLTGWTTTAVLTPALMWRRPMDSVQMTVLSSQEEEFALTAMGCESPYWSFCLPRSISQHDNYWQPEGFDAKQEARWARRYKQFLRKLTCFRRRTPLLKNPANTGRVAMLRRHFPRGKFVHIVRHPHDVYRSNQKLASQGLVVFQLQDPHPVDNYATRCLENYRELMDSYYQATHDLPAKSSAEVRYEDLVADPIAAVRGIYAQLGMTVTPEYERRLTQYLESVSGYRRNQHVSLSAQEKLEVDGAMAPYLRQWGYQQDRRAAA